MKTYFVTVGLNNTDLDMEILVDKVTCTEDEAENIGIDFQKGYLYEDQLVIENNALVIKKDETEKYQFSTLKKRQPVINEKDIEIITWDEAVQYLIKKNKSSFPIVLKSEYVATQQYNPFLKFVGQFVHYDLEDIQSGKVSLITEAQKEDVLLSIQSFEREFIAIKDWHLFEIAEASSEKAYGFQNKNGELFYMKITNTGEVSPCYFKNHGLTDYSVFVADTIKEAIKRYENFYAPKI